MRKSEVYIMTNAGKWHKISLHKSGEVHSAVTKEKYKLFGMTPEQRVAVRWAKALDINECGVMFNIAFPFSELYNGGISVLPENTMTVPLSKDRMTILITFLKVRATKKQVELQIGNVVETHILHTVRIDDENILVVCYYYTDEIDSAICSARNQFEQYLNKIPLPSEPMKLTSGFVTITDKNENPYHIEFQIK